MSELSPEEIVNDLSFCIIDLETTGGNYKKDKIIEIGMVKLRANKIEGEKSFLINPEMQIPDFIQKLTNISQKDVKDAPKIEAVIDEVIDFIGDDIIVAHNTSFDVPFLNGILKTLDRDELENKVICTNVMTKHLIPEILNSNLNYMSKLFKISHSKAHRAHDDALATAELLKIYLDIFKEKGIKKVNQLYYPRNKFELDRIHFDQETQVDSIIDLIQKQKSSMLITVKGTRGLILAVLPIQDPHDEGQFVKKILDKLPWKIVTVRLIKPLLEGLFQFNNHFLKYPEEIRFEILNYLKDRYKVEKVTQKLEQLDFILAHHLIEDQVMAYSFLSLNTNKKALFKIPAQKKKLIQYLNSQVNRFEGNQKGKRKVLLHPEVIPLIESYLELNRNEQRHLYINRKDVKKNKDSTMKMVESFVAAYQNDSNFPTDHL
ncbi:MAG: hypothetical protein CME62_10705 [Halobacteriovoraceae bacterium]|nr:hypothetical protein [Halobacteriovoraceae bacterium]|tara:strand:+ start:11936 stop:13231 length:1296 start_codon:yes stop_codon:yes gene_type:complete